MRKELIILSVLIVLVVVGCSSPQQAPSTTPPPSSTDGAASGSVKEFHVQAYQFGYDPETIEVNKGDTVRIIATTRDVPHGLNIPDYGVNMIISPGSESKAEFVADKQGTFTFFCSVPCGPGHKSMKGQLIVK